MSRVSAGSAISIVENNDEIIAMEKRIQDQMRKIRVEHSRKNWKKLFLLFAERDEMVMSIPDFWYTVIQCEERILKHFTEQDFELLNFFDDLELSYLQDEHIIKVDFKFRSNTHFHNHIITRKYSLSYGKLRLSSVTPISWKKGHEPPKKSSERESLCPTKPPLMFFDWLASLEPVDKMGIWVILKMYPNAYKMFARAQDSALHTASILSEASMNDTSHSKLPCETITEQA
ncbi:Oidioi.mRNA.OKI2018_I69.PAR.g11327.t1.cds [Oikopleura dioica]|uniref:Oidioi.mRNA.OKI2018_I69.PAR.g11327.t1.cds n=1 Tax=Oikopleura dioica TaxID=34765 RepID=A0ABN7S1F8_OIKDI|nr:Oidioi.mRNA.OKI2018_I69.PAR.g11327.t1.cds [Oikopleura dioica]